MLVLSRHRDESIIIGDNIIITVVDIRGDKVRLGIQAPIDIPVHRQEVYEAIKREEARRKQAEEQAKQRPEQQQGQQPPDQSDQPEGAPPNNAQTQ
jgi:carbon storage regulator